MKKILKNILVKILTLEARIVLWKYEPKIVGITGSVGKTSTKDAVHTVLSVFYDTRKSPKSYNSEIGVPLTILGCGTGWGNAFTWVCNLLVGIRLILFKEKYPEWLVLEIGADRPGDIKKLASWLPLDIAVVTRIGKAPVHVEYFHSVKHLVEEKRNILRGLKDVGVLVLNNDDEDARMFKEDTKYRVVTYGSLPSADVTASGYKILYDTVYGKEKPSGIEFKASYKNVSFPFKIYGSLGEQHMYPVLAALGVVASLGLNINVLAAPLSLHQAPLGRMKIIKGVKNTIIIDDSYNSSPIALEEALNTLEQLHFSGRKIAVLGDMLELGKFSHNEHIKAGGKAASIIDVLMTVGVRGREIAEGALQAKMDEENIFQYDTPLEAGKELQRMLKDGDTVLVKGSQGVRIEKVVEEIMVHPEDKEKLLVRQEREWSER